MLACYIKTGEFILLRIKCLQQFSVLSQVCNDIAIQPLYRDVIRSLPSKATVSAL